MKINQTNAAMQKQAVKGKQVKPKEQEEIKDQVTLGSKVKTGLSEAAEFPLGAVGSAVGTATNIIPGMFTGAFGDGGFEVGHILQGVALGTTGGVILDGILPGGKVWAGIIGGAVGAGVSLARLGLYHATDSDDTIKDNVKDTVKRYRSDNVQTKDDDVHDGIRDLIEGGGVGTLKGGVEGAKTGYYEGKGVAAGIGEGIKGAVQTLTGQYPVQEQEKGKLTVGKAIGKAVKAPISLASGVIGAISTLPAGTIHGIKAGVKLAQGEELTSRDLRKTSKSAAFWTKIGTIGLGTAAGALTVGGPWGIAGGVAAGLVGAAVIHKLQKTGEGDKEIAKGILNAVNYAHNDNAETGNKVHDGYRDVIESVFVGPLAGLREGFRVGYIGADAAQDGVAEVLKELVHKSPDSTKPQQEQELTYEQKEAMNASYPFGIKKPEKPQEQTAVQQETQNYPEQGTAKPDYTPPHSDVPHEKSGIRKGVEALGGAVIGAGSTALHTVAGGVEGVAEGLRSDKLSEKEQKYRRADTGVFTFSNVAALTAGAGGVTYFLSGGNIVATAIASGGGLLAGIALRAFEGDEGTKKIVETIDLTVDKGVEDNKEGSAGYRKGKNISEGLTAGMKAAGKVSWDVGYEGGKVGTGFVIDVARGVGSGVKELAKDAIGLGPKKGEVKKDEN